MTNPATLPTDDDVNFSLMSDAEYITWQDLHEPTDGVASGGPDTTDGIDSVPF